MAAPDKQGPSGGGGGAGDVPPEAPPAATPPPAAAPATDPAITARRRAEDKPADPAKKKRRRVGKKGTENVIGAFLLAILVGLGIVWIENGRCPGVLRGAFSAAAPVSIPLAVVIAALLANQDRSLTRSERIGRGVRLGGWAAVAALSMVTGILMTLNESGAREIEQRRCLIARRETVPARTAGVGEWVLVLRCSASMSPVRVDVDRRTWWDHEAGGTIPATIARGSYGFEWVVDTELGPPLRGFTSW